MSVMNFEALPSGMDIGSTVIAVCALIVAIWTAYIQRVHNRLSVRPLAEVRLRDMNGQIRIQLCNNGTGPLIISALIVSSDVSAETWESLFAAIPAPPSDWSFYVGNIDGRSIRPGSSIDLLEFSYEMDDVDDCRYADEIRAHLKHLSVLVSYEDVYGTKPDGYTKKLDWFGRNL